MSSPGLPTRFAPAERFPLDVIRRQNAAFHSSDLLMALLDTCPCLAAALNSRRQIVYCNNAMLHYAAAKEVWQVLGKRPGEAVDCVHACETEGGCGTAEACRYCGAVLTVLDALNGKPGARECRITRLAGDRLESLDLFVSAAPVLVEGERFVTIAIEDISHEKRRRALERIFFHDVMNTAGAMRGLADVLVERTPDDGKRLAETLRAASNQLVAEIATQRTLAAAEGDELTVDPELVGTLALLQDLAARWSRLPQGKGRAIEIDPKSYDSTMVTDRTLLGRVLDNMLKNALEASRAGERIEAGCRLAGGQVEFWVRNPAVMPPDVQMQVFQRSFSTKGLGRGLGTYSMLLLTQRYLGGTVSFSSKKGEGTEFRARYPRVLR